MMDLTKENDAYIYGLLLADGHLGEQSRNRGRIEMELKISDISILNMIREFFSEYNCKIRTRCRNTNFKNNSESCTITFHSLELRNILKSFGFPVGKKCDIANTPKSNYNKKSFWRGYLDGNGSFSFSKTNIPLVSLGTKSEFIKNEYISLLKDVTGEIKNINRNKRDNFYNIISYRENALKMINFLDYKNAELFIKRKKESALNLLTWVRTVKKINN